MVYKANVIVVLTVTYKLKVQNVRIDHLSNLSSTQTEGSVITKVPANWCHELNPQRNWAFKWAVTAITSQPSATPGKHNCGCQNIGRGEAEARWGLLGPIQADQSKLTGLLRRGYRGATGIDLIKKNISYFNIYVFQAFLVDVKLKVYT